MFSQCRVTLTATTTRSWKNFFVHQKAEMFHGEIFDTVAEFNQAIDEYMQRYNTERIQQRLKGLTPMQYRNQTLEALTA